MSRLLITGAGAVTFLGLGLEPLRAAIAGEVAVGFDEEQPTDGPAVQVGRVGYLKDGASAATYRRWGQVDTYSRYGYVAARIALDAAGCGEDTDLSEFGVFLGTAYGCIEENQKFERFQIVDGQLKGASPLVFKGTVDNAPAGWIAVAWKLKGPNATFVSGDGAGLEAMWAACRQIRRGRATGVLTGGVERFVDLHLVLRERDPERQGAVLSEGAGVLLMEDEAAHTARGGTADQILAEVLGVVRHRGSLQEGFDSTLVRLGINLADVGLVSLGVPETAQAEAFGVTLRARIGGAATDGIEVSADKALLGEFHGAWGGIAACAALVRRVPGRGWGDRAVAIVHAFGEGDESFYLALREPDTAE